MSSKKPTNDTGNEESERERLLSELSDQVDFIRDRIDRLASEEDPDEMALIRWVRTQAYVASTYRKLSADVALEEMQDDVALLKQIADVGEEP